ncbi:hypothetical protein QLX08_001525 [Tetragonisca angustula]|uniref:Uncharacterized protein n=1 Tax=Tetragonisca angustula TaxID=166442 RepID=A0AAW1AF45_9HYME
MMPNNMAKQHTPPVQQSHRLTNIDTTDHFIEQLLSHYDHMIIAMKKHDTKYSKRTCCPIQESHRLTNIATTDHFIEQSLSRYDHMIIAMKKHDAKHSKTTYSACARKPQTD